jgi:S-adenosylmethionine:diacylglycerol 3-amino-3-carboxypropyl transferase
MTDLPVAVTPWAAGRLDTRTGRAPHLLFGRMVEDPAVDLAALPPLPARVLCIASAGDTARALAAAGHHVLAVDTNPCQLDEVRRRLAGEGPRAGRVDRLLAAGRTALAPLGWRPDRLARFCALDDPDRQVHEWDRLTGPAVRAALAAVLRPRVLRLAYGPAFAALVPPGFAATLLDRVGRGVRLGPNRDNPWLAWLLTGHWSGPETEPSCAPTPFSCTRAHDSGVLPRSLRDRGRIELRRGDVADVLAALPPGSLAGATLSNVLDGPGDAYRRRLLAAARRAVRPGGAVVSRSLLTAPSPAARARALTDRSLLWGGIEVLT